MHISLRGASLAFALLSPLALTNSAAGVTAAEVGGCAGTVPERTIDAGPGDYLGVLPTLGPGDLLRLAPGTYAGGLPLTDLHGAPGRCITIEGPAAGPPAVFLGRDCCNTVSLRDVSYLVLRRLELDGQGRLGDGVKAESTSTSVHHLTLEDLYVHGHGADQQIVGINSKCRAWAWVLRRNVIERAGTGIYLGDSNGEAEHVASLLEHNLIVDSRGYNLQIKHQNGRATGLGMPTAAQTVIRHNVLSKAQNASTGGLARPNMLLGHWPLSGPGADDDYLVYGNFFHQNPSGEPLFQAEGNVILYDNLFLNSAGSAVRLQPHNHLPRRMRVFHNTVVARDVGIAVSGGESGYEQRLVGNAVFAGQPLSGGVQTGNVTDAYPAAASYLQNPEGRLSGAADRLDLHPLPGTLGGPPLDLAELAAYADADRDFNGTPRPGSWRGAYAGEGPNPGWRLALERKPESAVAVFADGFESGDLDAWTGSAP